MLGTSRRVYVQNVADIAQTFDIYLQFFLSINNFFLFWHTLDNILQIFWRKIIKTEFLSVHENKHLEGLGMIMTHSVKYLNCSL